MALSNKLNEITPDSVTKMLKLLAPETETDPLTIPPLDEAKLNLICEISNNFVKPDYVDYSVPSTGALFAPAIMPDLNNSNALPRTSINYCE